MTRFDVNDNVNHPQHYKTGIKCDNCDKEIECINISRNFNFALGNVIKYVWRAKHKGEYAEQLRKARWYLNDEIDRADGINFCERVDSENAPAVIIKEPGVETIMVGKIRCDIHQLPYIPKNEWPDLSWDKVTPPEIKKLKQIKEYVENIWYQYMAVSNPNQRDSSLCVEAIQTLVEQMSDFSKEV